MWLGGGLPPMGAGFLKDFTTHYMDPTEVYERLGELAAEFPNISRADHAAVQDERLPAPGAGEHERHDGIGNAPAGRRQSQTVVITSRAWGHEGGNDIKVEFRNPGVAELAAERDRQGKQDHSQPRDRAAGALSSTAAQVVVGDQREPRGERA